MLEDGTGLPGKKVTINRKEIELPDDIYRDYCLSYGSTAKREMSKIVTSSWYQKIKKDELKLKALDKIISKIRNTELKKAKVVYMKSMK